MSKPLLITGATGKQGRACIEALLASPQASTFTILAATRNRASPSATALSHRAPNVKVVQGDLDDSRALFTAASHAVETPIWGVYGVTTPTGGGEERQGKNLVNAAVASGVSHFVFTSAERGGEKSQTTPTNVPHFISKYHIEQHLQTQAAEATAGTMSWTVFRPVAFMDNLTPDLPGKLFATAWKNSTGNTKPLQLISSHDCGVFAAQAFLNPQEHRNKAFSIAADELTYEQADRVFRSKLGHGMPTTYAGLASLGLWAIKDLGLMFRWFQEEGFGVDVAACKRMQPGLLGFAEWVETKSRFARAGQ